MINTTIFTPAQDALFMQEALSLAQQSFEQDEVPIGALVVTANGCIVGRGYNQVEQCYSQAAHAEFIAIQQATIARKDWRLDGCWLYVTLEPCAMCMALIKLSRIEGVVFAAASPLFGYRLDNEERLSVYNRDLLMIVEGIGAHEAELLLKTFFQNKRKKSGKRF